MLPERGQRVAEVDRNFGCSRTLRLEIAVAGDRPGRIVRKELVRGVELVRDRIARPAGDHQKK